MSLLRRDANGNPVQTFRQGTVDNTCSYSATAAQSAAIGSSGGTPIMVRLCPTTSCYYLVGADPTATAANGSLLPALAVETIEVQAGSKISAIRLSADGILSITQMV